MSCALVLCMLSFCSLNLLTSLQASLPGQAQRGNTSSPSTSTSQDSRKAQQSLASPVPWGTACLAVLTQRCSDQAPSIRAKALSLLAAAVGEGGQKGQPGEICQVKPFFRQNRASGSVTHESLGEGRECACVHEMRLHP